METDLRGTEFVFFTQPLAYSVPVCQAASPSCDAVAVTPMALVGVIRKSTLAEQSHQVPAIQVAFVLLGLVCVLSLMWPLIMLLTMSPRERLTALTVSGFTLGIVGGLALLTLLVLSWGFGITLNQRTQLRLQGIANRMERNVATEIRSALCSLKVQGDKLIEIARSTPGAQSKMPDTYQAVVRDWPTLHADDKAGFEKYSLCQTLSPVLAKVDTRKLEERNASDAKAGKPPIQTPFELAQGPFWSYPFFEHIIVLDARRQKFKLSADAVPTPLLPFSLSRYPSLRRIEHQDSPYHQHQPNQPEYNVPFAAESLFSPSTGKQLTIIAANEEAMRKFQPGAAAEATARHEPALHHRQIVVQLKSRSGRRARSDRRRARRAARRCGD